jgi:molybdopterin-biosynthesis enzyme MoeA-like protein
VKVGDNLARIIDTIRYALERSDAVVVCGGLGPTQDDITREAIAEVMGVGLERDEVVVARIRSKAAAGVCPTTTSGKPTSPPGDGRSPTRSPAPRRGWCVRWATR